VDELQVSEDTEHSAFASLQLSSTSFELERNEWEVGLGKKIAVKKYRNLIWETALFPVDRQAVVRREIRKVSKIYF